MITTDNTQRLENTPEKIQSKLEQIICGDMLCAQ